MAVLFKVFRVDLIEKVTLKKFLEREREWGGRGRGRERETLRQAPFPAQSLKQTLISQPSDCDLSQNQKAAFE